MHIWRISVDLAPSHFPVWHFDFLLVFFVNQLAFLPPTNLPTDMYFRALVHLRNAFERKKQLFEQEGYRKRKSTVFWLMTIPEVRLVPFLVINTFTTACRLATSPKVSWFSTRFCAHCSTISKSCRFRRISIVLQLSTYFCYAQLQSSLPIVGLGPRSRSLQTHWETQESFHESSCGRKVRRKCWYYLFCSTLSLLLGWHSCLICAAASWTSRTSGTQGRNMWIEWFRIRDRTTTADKILSVRLATIILGRQVWNVRFWTKKKVKNY